MDVANLIVALLSLLVTGAIGWVALRLQAASAEREQREDRRTFAASVDEWARLAEDELLEENPDLQAQYLRMSLTSDMTPLVKMRPEFLVEHVEKALERILQVPMTSRASFIKSVRAMRRANMRRWVVDPTTTEENEAHYATGTLSVRVGTTAAATVEPGQGLSGEGTMGLM